jgi:hypothetical protein
MDIKEFIKSKRPSLSDGSLTTYTSILRSLYKKVFGTGTIDTEKFNDTDKILDFLKDLEPNKRKTILSGLVVVTDKKEYRDKMLDDVSSYNKEIKKQEKSETQKENWVTTDEVKSIYNTLKKNADMLYKKKSFTSSELQQIQNFIILSLLGGIFIPPRRSLDFVSFKHKNIDKTKDNYLEKSKMVFNTYKTAKTYGQQVVDIPIQLKNILTKWNKINPTDYLLFDTNGNKLNSVKLNQRLNAIFDGKKIAVNGLRHAFLTDKYAETSKKQKELESDMTDMGSSSNMSKTYIKLD